MPDLIVRRIEGGAEIKRIYTKHTDPGSVAKILAGLLINMDRDTFFVDVTEFDFPKGPPP